MKQADPREVRWTVIYRAFLRLYPPSLRRRFGDRMVEDARELVAAERARGRGINRVLFRVCVDVLRSAPGEWWQNVRGGTRRNSRPRGLSTAMDQLLYDVRLAARALRRSPAFSITAILSIAAAIVVVASAFAVTNAYMVRSMPFPDAERLVRMRYAPVGEREPGGLAAMDWSALADVFDWVDQSISTRLQLAGTDDATDVIGLMVAPRSLEPLGARIAAGRDFLSEEYRPGAQRVVIAGAAVMRGRTITDLAPVYLDLRRANSGEEFARYRVVGVLEPGYRPPRTYSRGEIDFVLPQTEPGAAYAARLRPGVQLASAERRVTDAVRRNASSLPDGWRGVQMAFIQEEYVSGIRPMLIAVTAAALLVLLIVAANVAVLVVLRALRREREIAMRVALGAPALRIARLLSAEAVLVSAIATGLGLVATAVALSLAAPVIESRLGLPVPGGTAALGVDGTVLLAVGAGALAVAVLLSLAPLALLVTRRLDVALRSGVRAGDSPGVRRARSLLLALQVAASVVLLFGGALIARTVSNLVRTDLGYDAETLMRARIRFPEQPFPDSASIAGFQIAFESTVRARIGTPVAIATVVPFWEAGQERIEVSGTGQEQAAVTSVSGRYFEVAGLSLSAGRPFTDSDDPQAEPVAIVSETFAGTLGARVIGMRLRIINDRNPSEESAVWRTIVGVVSDVRETHRDTDFRDVYLPALQSGVRYASVFTRAVPQPYDWYQQVRAIAREINPGVEMGEPVALVDGLRQELAAPRFLRSVLAGLATLALGIALLGIYGVTAYAVEQRRREIAVRSALGAPARTITSMFLNQTARVVVVGVAAGVLGALWLGRLLQNQVFGLRPTDTVTLAATAAVVAAACLAATWLPSRLSARVDPAEVFRSE